MKLKVKVGPKGQIVIPKHVRESLGIRSGDEVLIEIEGKKATTIEPLRRDPIEVLLEISKQVGGGSSELVWGDRLYESIGKKP
jgi:AbrB family looped-hinge helix DNA binding protein